MKNFWKRVPLENWQTISEKVKNYIITQTDILSNESFWNDLDFRKFDKSVPELRLGFEKLDLNLVGCFAVVVRGLKDFKIHDDIGDPHSTRINIPILNCIGTSTIFYEGKIEESQLLELPGGFPYHLYDFDKCKEVDRVEINQPTALNVWTPHAIYVPPDSPIPRITITCGFTRDPVDFLL